jgi:hypothetical protein
MALSLSSKAIDALIDLPGCRIQHTQLEHDTRKWLGDKLISAEVANRMVGTKLLSSAGELTVKHSKIVDRSNMAFAFHELDLGRFVTIASNKEHDLADGLEALCAWLHSCKDSRAQLAFAVIVDVLVDNGTKAHLEAIQMPRMTTVPSSRKQAASSTVQQPDVDLLDLQLGECADIAQPQTLVGPSTGEEQTKVIDKKQELDFRNLADLQRQYQQLFKNSPSWGPTNRNATDEQLFNQIVVHEGREYIGDWAKGKSEAKRLALLKLMKTLSSD